MKFLKTGYQTVVIVLSVLLLQSCALTDKATQDKWLGLLDGNQKKSLSTQDIAAGLKEALIVGSERVVSKVGKKDGYLKDRAIFIPLPNNMKKVHQTLDKIGLGRYTKELEVKMNRAAEIAAPKAKKLFWTAIKDMRWADVKAIYQGNDDAATQYFKRKMTPSLKKMMRPVIDQTLAEVGVLQAYKKVLKEYHAIPLVPRINDDISGYVMDKGINGMFYYLAKEETAIRKDPVKRTSELLKRVFG